MPDNSNRILLVDDEPALLNLMEMFLTKLGYSVVKQPNATGALAAVTPDPDAFNVVVVDLTLPDMHGKDLALKIAELGAKPKILLCSGYPFELDTLPKDIRPRFGFLQKPFLPKMLAASVEELVKR